MMELLTPEMSAMDIRLILKNKGWDSEDRLSQTGWGDDYGYSLWFSRWDWHGIKVGKVCVHASTPDLSQIQKITYDTARFALKAWDDFTESVPHQMAHGNLKDDPIQTPFFQKAKRTGKINEKELVQMYDKLMEQKD